jgi:DEAD/DEAH box helicase domain-containing protein
VPGGVGLASRLFDERERLLTSAGELIDGCACEQGCPSCVGPADGGARKKLAREVLSSLSQRSESSH